MSSDTIKPPGSANPEPEPLKKAQDYAAELDWPGYYRAVLGKPPRDTLLAALEAFDHEDAGAGSRPPTPRLAIDLGCGEGRDTIELLRRGWRVLAIDDHADAFVHLAPRVRPEDAPRLETRVAGFQRTPLPSADLVNASYALPFCEPADFPVLWDRIVQSIRPGGRFAGQLFGDRDAWAALPGRSHQTEDHARSLLDSFDVEQFRIEENDSPSTTGPVKHWHVFHIVARKRG